MSAVFKPLAVLGYIRCSTVEQTKEDKYGLEMQERKIREYASRLNPPLEVTFFKDLGVSGANPNRPEYRRMLDNIRSGDIIVTYDMTRIGRNLREFIDFLQKVHEKNARYSTCTLEVDTTTIHGEMICLILQVIAQYESKLTALRVKDGMAQRKNKLGTTKNSTKPPFGWMKSPTHIKGDAFVENPVEQDIIRKIMGYHHNGLGYAAIARTLEEENVPYQRKATSWDPHYIKKIIMRQSASEPTVI